MALTKAEKEFWVNELREELQKKINTYRAEIDECMEIAKAEAIDEVGLGSDWGLAKKQYAKLLKIHEDYKNAQNDLGETVKGLNKKLKPYEYTHKTYGYERTETISLSYSSPGTAYNVDKELSEDWLEKVAEHHFLEDVMRSRGVTAPLQLKEAQKTLKRAVMLATTTTKLKEFLEQFMEEWGVEL